MKFTTEHIKTILLAAVVVYLFFVRKESKPVDHTGEIKALEKVSESIARERDIYRQWKDDVNAQLIKRDSVLQTKLKTNNIKIYETIPAAVRNYNSDELRRAIENY